MKGKTESVAEFLARGGKITKVPTPQVTQKTESVKSTASGGPAVIMTMGEADLFYGEHKPRKVKKKSVSRIDLSALPEELRRKYVDEVLDAESND